ncbi:ABC transporter substrate-binding protein [Ureibacillus manganicus]|uniref:Solute-binding protein family 5 domain-containing protein n=1 Tax=Ureibacillus manganicus DSM 26584 TaxID=1384049 RepID=A0A0A3ITB6_9BACL|nr:ABC transporter substrate-binding protein [Ureibacillus manganicus]KGR78067.1 hypothetical protein CD29_13015 [Ureibacillus manganicus DSM 26584]
MRNLKSILLLVVLSVIALIIVGCSGQENGSTNTDSNSNPNPSNNSGETDTTARTEGGVLEFAFNAQPPTLDPLATTATATRDFARTMFEGLVTFDSNYQIQPLLAESFEVNQEENQVIFKIRKGVKFHNGKDLTVDDVVASMERWATKSAQAKSFLPGITFSAPDDETVVAQLEKTGFVDMYIFADQTQIAAIMPKEIAQQEEVKEYIGTGPYKFVEWKQDQYILVEKFDEYVSPEGEPDGLAGKREVFVDQIKFNIVPDSITRVTGLQTGEYHVGNFIPYDSFQMLDSDPNVEMKIVESSMGGLVFNKAKGVFSDIKMRQAVAAALDIDAINFAAYGDEKFFSKSPQLMLESQIDWYTDAGSENYNQKNIEKAKQLIEEAGYNGEVIRIITSREYEDYYAFCVVAHEQLKAIGLNVELEVYDWATVLEKRQNPDIYEIFASGWALRPTPVQYPFLDSAGAWPGWTNSEEIDSAIFNIRNAQSAEEAKEHTVKLQTAFWDYVPIIKMGNSMEISSYRSNVQGFDYFIGPVLWNVSIEK